MLRIRAKSLALAALIGIISVCSANAGIIADSIADFSGTQGQDGWYYGYFLQGDSTFYELPVYGSWYDTDMEAWQHPNAPIPWTLIGDQVMHPAQINNAVREEWAVRRWVSDYTGLVQLSAYIAKFNIQDEMGGDGVEGFIYHNGTLLWSQLLGCTDPTGYTFQTYINLQAGDIIDYVLSPLGNDWSDGTYFNSQIASVPEPGTFLLLGFGLAGLIGFGSRLRRR